MLAFYRFVGRPGFTRACWPRDLIRACPLTRAARPCLVRNPSCPGRITRPLFEARKVTQHAAHHRPDRHRLNQLPGAASRTRLAHPPPARQPKRHHHHRPLTHQRRAPRRTDHQPPRRTRRSPLTGHRSIVRRDQRGAAICLALTVRDDQGPGLVAAEEIRDGCPRAPSRARFSVHGFTSAVIGHCRQVRGPVGRGPGLSFGLIHPCPGPFTGVRGSLVRAGQGRSWTVVNTGAQYSKACEGATLPWVQIPPPPPLNCKNTDLGSRPAGASCSRGLIYWSGRSRDQRGAAICLALTVRDDQGPGLVAAEEIRIGAHERPPGARFSVHRFTSAVMALSAGARAGRGDPPWAQC